MVNSISPIRIKIIFVFLLSLFLSLFIRIIYLYDHNDVAKYAQKGIVKIIPRADILDRNGEILATNLITYSLYVSPAQIRNSEDVFQDLLKTLPILKKKQNLQEKIRKNLEDKGYKGRYLLVRDLTPKQKYEINNLGRVGLYFQEDYKRFYPHRNLFSHIIGFVDREEKGLAAFERYLDAVEDKRIEKGKDIYLSLNLDVQNIVKHNLAASIKKFNAKGGVGVVMNVNNFEIISMVSLPDYDPYYPIEIMHNKKFNNKATYDLHEMGSTFKTFTMALSYENGLIKNDEKIDISKNIRIAGYEIKDFKRTQKSLTIEEIFTKSSNIGTAKITKRFTGAEQLSFFEDLNLFKPLSIEIIEKNYSKFPKRWGISRKITASYGYGISTTAIHLSQALSAMVNGGYILPSTIIKDGNDSEDAVTIIEEDSSKYIRNLLEKAVSKGTGRRAKSKIYKIGGKTGSANKVGKRGYDENRLLSSFFGVFPIDNPQYLVFVFLDEPNGIKETGFYATGGVVAAPIVKNIIESSGPILGVEPKE